VALPLPALGRVAIAVVTLLAAWSIPLFATRYQLGVATTTVIFAVFALGLSLVVTHAGLPSLGHAAFFGVGGYTVGILSVHNLTNPLLVLAVAIGCSTALTLVVGPVLLRTRADYFLMATLALAQILFNLAVSMTSLTGGDNGLSGIQPPVIGGVELGERHTFYYACLAILLVVAVVVGWIARTPFGHLLRAVRDNPTRSAALGTGAFGISLVALVLSAVISAVAGVLRAYQYGFVAADSLSVAISGAGFLIVAIGGARAVAGPILGAIIVQGVAGLVATYTHRTNLVLGIIYVTVALGVLPATRRRILARVKPWLPSR
jgi:branched-chain amino acid transport system permease protein